MTSTSIWVPRLQPCKSLLVSVVRNLIDLDKYQGLCSSSDDVVLRTMNEIVSQGNYTLAGLSALLGYVYPPFSRFRDAELMAIAYRAQVVKSDVTAASAGLTLYALLLKHAVHDPPLSIVKVRINTIGIPVFAALNAIPKQGLIVVVALEFGYATPRPFVAIAIIFAAVATVFLGLLIWERSAVQSHIDAARDVEGGTVPT
ncbi:hypothetical protein JAAARDRAFT_210438 [Jaapia argillacea MUCL 33604]|uniref:Uncharacterized protein n=1 Tax=Jaapia argillacea MUCL 33604 TaxID=933084 RepID=A0A067PQ70_9AGAM|nr:hypothetical protein JAAARDRAFT_210438 [Jaapia argillacea MUCL 33604]